MTRQMTLVGFMQAGNVTVYSGSWRYPSADLGFLTMDYYTRIGKVLEEGKFDCVFFDDRLAMPGVYGDSVAEAVRYGARPVKLDLTAVLGGIIGATSRIGVGATYSTTYYQPYHVARTFATLDHLSGGRAAWNVVTSVNDSEAQNFGLSAAMDHDRRYDKADEFLETVAALWDSWDDGALIMDKETGEFADPAKVHEINHKGEWFSVRGPLTVPRTPQGRPVILQAGSSGRGREFAAAWADMVFTGDPGLEVARQHYREQKEQIAAAGRNPDDVKILPMAYVVGGETQAIAEEKERLFLDAYVHPVASLALLSELLNYDFAKHDLDDVVTDEMMAASSGIRGLSMGVRKHLGRDVTVRDLAAHRATLLQGPRFVGTATSVADQMEEWFNSGGCDGFVLAATHLPGAFEEFVRMVVPVLQQRGLFRREYAGSTLREHLGIAASRYRGLTTAHTASKSRRTSCRSGFRITRMYHPSFHAPDLDEVEAWFERVFGGHEHQHLRDVQGPGDRQLPDQLLDLHPDGRRADGHHRPDPLRAERRAAVRVGRQAPPEDDRLVRRELRRRVPRPARGRASRWWTSSASPPRARTRPRSAGGGAMPLYFTVPESAGLRHEVLPDFPFGLDHRNAPGWTAGRSRPRARSASSGAPTTRC